MPQYYWPSSFFAFFYRYTYEVQKYSECAITGDCFKGDRISIMEGIFHSLFSFFGGLLTLMRTSFHILNFLLGFEAWGNKRKKTHIEDQQ